MNSVVSVKKDVDNIKLKIYSEHEGMAFLDSDGSYGCDGERFTTKEAFEKYVKRKGYTRMYVVSWGNPER